MSNILDTIPRAAHHLVNTKNISNNKISIIHVTNKLCLPPISGGATRELEILSRISKHFEIHYIGFTKDFSADVQFLAGQIPKIFSTLTLISPSGIKKYGSNTPERVSDYGTDNGELIIHTIMEFYRPSLIHLVGYFLMQHLPSTCDCPVLLTEENVEFDLDARRALTHKSEAVNAEKLNKALELETNAWRNSDACIFVANEDKDLALKKVSSGSFFVIPNGIDTDTSKRANNIDREENTRLLFVGNFTWAPSKDAVIYLAKEIWPRILNKNSKIELVIAGYGLDKDLKEKIKSKSIECYGKYDFFYELLSADTIFICPIRFGGGNKMKIIDALSHGIPIISSEEGLRGFPDPIREFVSVANKPKEYEDFVTELVTKQSLREEIKKMTIDYVKLLPSWDDIANKYVEVIKEVIES